MDPTTPPQALVVWDTPTAFIVRLRWRPADAPGNRQMFQVLRIGDDKIREIADYRDIGPATKTAKRFAAA